MIRNMIGKLTFRLNAHYRLRLSSLKARFRRAVSPELRRSGKIYCKIMGILRYTHTGGCIQRGRWFCSRLEQCWCSVVVCYAGSNSAQTSATSMYSAR